MRKFSYLFFLACCDNLFSTYSDEACQQIRFEVMTSIAADTLKAVDSLIADFKACTLHSKTSLEITQNYFLFMNP